MRRSHQKRLRYLVAPLLMLAAAGAAGAQGVDRPQPAVDAEQVDAAIRRAVEHLYAIQTDRFDWEIRESRAALAGHNYEERERWFYGGRTALAVLALLYAGEDPQKEKLAKPIAWLKEVDLTGTYAVSLRTSVWSKLYTRALRPLLLKDAKWLVEAMTEQDGNVPGTFTYYKPHPGSYHGDHSNTQYGILGLRDAAARGVEIPLKYWEAIEKHMVTRQGVDGGWGYYVQREHPAAERTYGNMTVGGLANLYITFDRLQAKYETPCYRRRDKGWRRHAEPDAMDKAMAWLDRNLPVDFGKAPAGSGTPNPTGRPHGLTLYYLYGLERCGHASGRKAFGGINWFEEGTQWLLGVQRDDGGFRGAPVNFRGPQVGTSWAILFLVKGRAPVFYNKLDTGPGWNVYPRDIPNVSQFIADKLEQRINWQVVDIKDPVASWLDAPCLYFNGIDLPAFTDEQKQKLRAYTDSGGTLVAEAVFSSEKFSRAFRGLARQLWPEWELKTLDNKHPVMTFHHEIRGRVPRMMHIHDGCRSRVFLIVEDMACAWHQNLRTRYGRHFEFGMNLARYASDKRQLRSRLFYPKPVMKELADAGSPSPHAPAAAARITVADWPTEGRRTTDIRGMRHLAETLKAAANTDMDVRTVENHAPGDLGGVRVIHMSGHYSFTVSDENVAALRAFLDRGGLLWADPQCGRKAFSESFDGLLKRLLPDAEPASVPLDDPLITGKGLPREGFDVTRIRYKQALKLKTNRPHLKAVRRGGRPVVITSTYDLTCGLDGHDCADCLGPVRNDALKIATNIVLSALGPGAGAKPAGPVSPEDQ